MISLPAIPNTDSLAMRTAGHFVRFVFANKAKAAKNEAQLKCNKSAFLHTLPFPALLASRLFRLHADRRNGWSDGCSAPWENLIMCRNGPARPLIFIALDCDHTRLSPSQPNSYLLPAAVNARKLILNAIERGVIKWFYTLFRSSRSIYPASFCSVRLFAIIQLLLSCFSKKTHNYASLLRTVSLAEAAGLQHGFISLWYCHSIYWILV